MYRLTLKGKGYNEINFVFEGMAALCEFMKLAFKYSENTELKGSIEEILLPEECMVGTVAAVE